VSREADRACHVYSTPLALRERFVATDEFEERIRQAIGWRVFSLCPIYTDPLTIRQTWLHTASGSTYTDRAFYHLFAEGPFRAFLRLLLAHNLMTKERFLSEGVPPERLSTYLTFLHDQDMLLQTKEGYIKGPVLLPIHDLGHTLEAWVAEWLRRFVAEHTIRLDSPPGRAPVRHGARFTEFVKHGDPGDLDVVAVFPQGTILVECKSSLFQLDPPAWSRFAWRSAFLEPACALLLVDTPESQTSTAFRAAQRRLEKWQFTLHPQSNERICVLQRSEPVQANWPTGQSLTWETGTLRAALVGREHSLEDTLEAVFQAVVQESEAKDAEPRAKDGNPTNR
jgi:hypothetical protein